MFKFSKTRSCIFYWIFVWNIEVADRFRIIQLSNCHRESAFAFSLHLCFHNVESDYWLECLLVQIIKWMLFLAWHWEDAAGETFEETNQVRIQNPFGTSKTNRKGIDEPKQTDRRYQQVLNYILTTFKKLKVKWWLPHFLKPIFVLICLNPIYSTLRNHDQWNLIMTCFELWPK